MINLAMKYFQSELKSDLKFALHWESSRLASGKPSAT